MIRLANALFICFVFFNAPAADASSIYAKRKNPAQPAAAPEISDSTANEQLELPVSAAPNAPIPSPTPSNDQMMQTAVQSTMSSLTGDQLQLLAACLEKHIDSDTVNAIVGGGDYSGAGQAISPGSYQNAQNFIATPMGKQVMQNCNAEIQTLLPQVQQQFQQDLSQKPALAPAPVQ